MKFGEWLKKEKLNHELDKIAVAVVAEALGVSWRQIYRWAKGEIVPSYKNINKIAEYTKQAVTFPDWKDDRDLNVK